MTTAGRFIDLALAPPMSADARRSLARYLWFGRADVPAPLAGRAAQLAEQTPQLAGRVHSLGRFEDAAGLHALRACLPADVVGALRPQFEWYGCRGAGFHTDAHYDAVLFGAWCLAGPRRDIVFATPGLQLECAVGDLVVFDPFLPHAVLDSGLPRYEREHYAGAPASVFLGFELELTTAVRGRFGVGPPEAGAFPIGSGTPVNAETGQIVR